MSRYDIKDDLNRYGSPVYKAQEITAAPVVSEPTVLFSARSRAKSSPLTHNLWSGVACYLFPTSCEVLTHALFSAEAFKAVFH